MSHDDIEHPAAREALTNATEALGHLQEASSSMARDLPSEFGLGHPDLERQLRDLTHAFGATLQDMAHVGRANLAQIADMQRAEEAEATGGEGSEVERD